MLFIGLNMSINYPFQFSQDEHTEQSDESERPGVIVSNHISYVDILYHMSSYFPSFVAKVGQCLFFVPKQHKARIVYMVTLF